MIRFLAKDSLTFDCEWVPDVDAGRRLYAREIQHAREIFGDPGGEAPDREVMQTMFAMHPDYDAVDNPRPFLKPVLSKVISIATVRRSPAPRGELELGAPIGSVKIDARWLKQAEAGESVLVNTFLAGIGQLKPQLVGYNSKDADLQLLIQRAMVHRLTLRKFCEIPNKPWEGIDYFAKVTDWHIDLLNEIGGFDKRSRPTLEQACGAMNILGGRKDIDGGQVLDLYLAGELETIHRYCVTDAVRQFLLFLRLCLLAGHIGQTQHDEEEGEVIQQLEDLTAPAAPQPIEQPGAGQVIDLMASLKSALAEPGEPDYNDLSPDE